MSLHFLLYLFVGLCVLPCLFFFSLTDGEMTSWTRPEICVGGRDSDALRHQFAVPGYRRCQGRHASRPVLMREDSSRSTVLKLNTLCSCCQFQSSQPRGQHRFYIRWSSSFLDVAVDFLLGTPCRKLASHDLLHAQTWDFGLKTSSPTCDWTCYLTAWWDPAGHFLKRLETLIIDRLVQISCIYINKP